MAWVDASYYDGPSFISMWQNTETGQTSTTPPQEWTDSVNKYIAQGYNKETAIAITNAIAAGYTDIQVNPQEVRPGFVSLGTGIDPNTGERVSIGDRGQYDPGTSDERALLAASAITAGAVAPAISGAVGGGALGGAAAGGAGGALVGGTQAIASGENVLEGALQGGATGAVIGGVTGGLAGAPTGTEGMSEADLAQLIESGTVGEAGAALETAAVGTTPWATPIALPGELPTGGEVAGAGGGSLGTEGVSAFGAETGAGETFGMTGFEDDLAGITGDSIAQAYLGSSPESLISAVDPAATTSGSQFLGAGESVTPKAADWAAGDMFGSGDVYDAGAGGLVNGAQAAGPGFWSSVGEFANKYPALATAGILGGVQTIGGVIEGIGASQRQEDQQAHERALLEQKIEDQKELEEWKRQFTQSGSFFDAKPGFRPAANRQLRRPDGTPVFSPGGMIAGTMR